jgi:hypothetical protein
LWICFIGTVIIPQIRVIRRIEKIAEKIAALRHEERLGVQEGEEITDENEWVLEEETQCSGCCHCLQPQYPKQT